MRNAELYITKALTQPFFVYGVLKLFYVLYKYFVIASDVALFVLLVILSDVASACGAGKSEQRRAPRSKVVRAPSE